MDTRAKTLHCVGDGYARNRECVSASTVLDIVLYRFRFSVSWKILGEMDELGPCSAAPHHLLLRAAIS